MWGTEPELLVVLDLPGIRAEVRAEVRAALAAIGPVTATLDPRLALVAAPASRVSEVAAIPGVRGVFTDEVPPALRETFGVGECLFVDGWLARKAEKHRDPPDGEPWDAPGRLPPDPPPGFPPGRRPGPRPG